LILLDSSPMPAIINQVKLLLSTAHTDHDSTSQVLTFCCP